MLDIELERIIEKLKLCGFLIKDTKTIQYGVQLKVLFGEEEAVVRFYGSKKAGLKLDTSLIKSDELRNKVKSCFGNVVRQSLIFQKLDDKFDFYIGSDESGKGDYFGPLVVAGVEMTGDNLRSLESSGIKDSKALNEERIFCLESEIINSKVLYKRITLLPEKYNNMYEFYKSKNANLNDILARLHFETISYFLDEKSSFKVVVDKFSVNSGLEKKFLKYKNVKFFEVVRAESEFLFVAAASILARAEFLRQMKRLSDEVGVKLKRGSVNVKDIAQKIVEQYGLNGLKKVAKLHFKITRELKL
ncbi:ribonuclease HII/HIII [Thermodesulfobium narugense DSM 14796]|uniref:Ribonuclease n=1 Tax=Thermodesulfobium narugense DSM 14796 TaxID=747365 RepID=M1E4F0_9BACT|nr:ribonuclease HIII [Thermodesulfobium narugense]AEE14087.1 ribonuclease HII/HIII [Thermodesulfobium narugense DSM 14796]